jgi:hypothetical protein
MLMRGLLWVLLVSGFVISSCGGDSLKVVLDPDGRLLRDDVVEDCDCQALTIAGPEWGRTVWAPDVRPVESWLGVEGALMGWPQGVPPPVVFDSLIGLTFEPESRSLTGFATLTVQADSQALTQVSFALNADAVDSVLATDPDATFEYSEGRLVLTPAVPIQPDSTWTVSIAWHTANLETIIDNFEEGGGLVLANALGTSSTFFTYGYNFWPRLLGATRPSELNFAFTRPADMTLLFSGVLAGSVDNGDGTATDSWTLPVEHRGRTALALGEYEVASGACGDATLEIYGMPGLSIDGFEIVPASYLPTIEAFCDDFVARFGQPRFGVIRFVGVDERFTNGYAAPGLVLVPNYSWDDDGTGSFIERDFYLGHELSHQWWGNDVWIAAVRDIWLVEGMADYVTSTAAEHIGGAAVGLRLWMWEVGPLLNWLRAGQQDHPLVPEDGADYEPVVVYVKGAWVLRMLETVIGQAKMDQLLADVRAAHPFAVLTTEGFTALAQGVFGQELGWFFEQWLFGTGILALEASARAQGDQIELTITQTRAWADAPARYYRTPVTVELSNGGRTARHSVEIDAETGVFLLPAP